MQQPQHSSHRRLGRGMIIAAWVVALGLLTLFFYDRLEEQRNPNRHLSSHVSDAGVREVVLTRNRFGHYVTTGYINGKKVEFLLDTGASDVSIPAVVAERLGLEAGRPHRYQTANGPITAYRTRADEIRLGSIVVNDVPASINPHIPGDGILLGMSFLKQLEFTQRGNKLILKQ